MEANCTIASFSDEEKLFSLSRDLMGSGLSRKISDKEVWNRSIWMDNWKCTQGVKIFVSHLYAHQRASTVRDNQVDKMI